MIETMLMKENVSGDDEVLLAGTMDHGWFGEVAAEDFITGDGLSTEVGLTGLGISQNSNVGWLKFSLERKILYVAKRSIRYYLSWDDLNNLNLVTGNRTVTIANKVYKVRLLKGGSIWTAGYDTAEGRSSEWNRLLYHLSGKPFGFPSNTLASEGISEGDWAKYSEYELGVNLNFDSGRGTCSICQELNGSTGKVTFRGYRGVSYCTNGTRSQKYEFQGWRPCLELVD